MRGLFFFQKKKRCISKLLPIPVSVTNLYVRLIENNYVSFIKISICSGHVGLVSKIVAYNYVKLWSGGTASHQRRGMLPMNYKLFSIIHSTSYY